MQALPNDLVDYWNKYLAAFKEVLDGMDKTDKVTIRMSRNEIAEFRANLARLVAAAEHQSEQTLPDADRTLPYNNLLDQLDTYPGN